MRRNSRRIEFVHRYLWLCCPQPSMQLFEPTILNYNNIAGKSSKGRNNYLDVFMWKKRHQTWHHTIINNHLNLLVSSVGQITKSPDCVDQNLRVQIKDLNLLLTKFYWFIWSYVGVGMMNQGIKSWQQFAYSINMRRRVFIATEVHDYPCYITKEANGYCVCHKTQ